MLLFMRAVRLCGSVTLSILLPIYLSEKAINCFLLCKIREIISLQSKGICLKLTEPITALFNSKWMLLKNMRRSNKGSNLLIIIGIVGLIAAVIIGILIWRAILD